MMPNEATCPTCILPQSEWWGNDGSGYDAANGQTYCYEGCFDDTGCTCRAESSEEKA